MTDFKIDIAGICVRVNAFFATTKQYCELFTTDKDPENYVSISEEDIEFARKKALEETQKAGTSDLPHSDQYLETVALLRALADFFPDRNRMLIHGSAICVDGKGYLIAAPSGTGKSTHSALLRRLLGDRAVMINDDKPFLDFSEKTIRVCGSPWMGKHRLGSNISAPLCGIFFISQAPDNKVVPITAYDALPLLLPQCHRPRQTAAMLSTLDMMDRLLAEVSSYSLECNMEISAAELSYKIMSK